MSLRTNMKHGNYGPGNTDFKKLQVSKFPLTLWDGVAYGHCGCGATALALITGKNPLDIADKNGRRHYSDRFMVDFLRKHGVSVFEVNRANLTRSKKWEHQLGDNNVVLYSAHTAKGESSYFVTFCGYLYHNFSISKANYLDFLNFPIDSCYVLFKKSWNEI